MTAMCLYSINSASTLAESLCRNPVVEIVSGYSAEALYHWIQRYGYTIGSATQHAYPYGMISAIARNCGHPDDVHWLPLFPDDECNLHVLLYLSIHCCFVFAKCGKLGS